MGYSSRYGRRPFEYASKTSHAHLIKDPTVKSFLEACELPRKADAISIPSASCISVEKIQPNPIKHVIAVDGGFSEVAVRSEFPSATVCFYQFGALFFDVDDLNQLGETSFVDPDDIEKLKRIQRVRLSIPVRNITLKGEKSITGSVRRAIYRFFMDELDDGRLIETLRWIIFEDFDGRLDEWMLASCPVCSEPKVPVRRKELSKEYSFKCPSCKETIFLTDVFRLHEAIDDELGAGGVLSYLGTTVEQLILAHLIRTILSTKPSLLEEVIFIKDGPLAFFGQTANIHKPFRALINYLVTQHNCYLAGLEKSGAFVDHAHEITPLLKQGSALLLNDDYIYRYIIPGKADASSPYGRTTYYGNKVIFKSSTSHVYVITIPTLQPAIDPAESDYVNLRVVLENIAQLRCDMYDDALIPVALVNKLVSLANHPSTRILQKFARETVPGVAN